VGHVAGIRVMSYAYQVSEKPEEKKEPGRSRSRWEDNIKRILGK
jgi:hypothetical protein